MPSSTAIYKKASTDLVSFDNDISFMKKIKSHLADCECCRRSLSLDNNNEAGYQPAPIADTIPRHREGVIATNDS